MLECVAAIVGVPLNRPVALSNAAHVGLLAMANVSTSPFASLADGVKEYVLPTCTDAEGEPLITGGVGATPFTTVMEKAGSATRVVPSLTRITIFDDVPTAPGVPESLPVSLEKRAQVGLLRMLKMSALPSASCALGVNEYR